MVLVVPPTPAPLIRGALRASRATRAARIPVCGVAGARPHPAPGAAVVRVVLAALLATALGLVAAPASAHDELLSSDPADGAVLTNPPGAITLLFSDPPLDVGNQVILRNSAKETVAQGEPTIEGNAVRLPITEQLPDGAYTVSWRVVSGDGHPIEGAFTFSVGTVTSPSAATSQTVGATGAANPAEGSSGEKDSSSPVPWVIGGGVIVAVVLIGVVLLRRRSGAGPAAASGGLGQDN